ncbi:GNAT family N-acetyltransferase [Tenacibaculum soleae]|uniref:Acetyltransferase n=1 Tax=Tenacibaculum soleae TaxID=447689 RepID=A0A1B9Y3N9_9FLAO|nr:GNAT family N-acetyltransferase [Tenacibaculum soleae]MDO6813785.1 GNAT family N-acetyltransferase [Tenacibaculum soleae]OCK44402.1 acetyltransferase [Tenacibaculum soleae]
MNINFKPINKKNILIILPLLRKLNTTTPDDILKERIIEMATYNTYECVGIFDNDKLIGICGLWYSTRHYIGKSVEPDHVIIDDTYRGKNLGKQFFSWIYEYTKAKGCEVAELNTYTGNRKSHKFYCNEGFDIYGFHFVKVMREDQKFY